MQQQTFDYMLEEICGAFGRQRPINGSPAYRSIYRRVCEEMSMPDEAAKFIANAMSDYDSLPSNLGKAIIHEFYNWRSTHSELKPIPKCCPECSSDTPGFIRAYKGMYSYLVRCVCNNDPRWANDRAATRSELLRAGYRLEDPFLPVCTGKEIEERFQKAIGHVEEVRPRVKSYVDEYVEF